MTSPLLIVLVKKKEAIEYLLSFCPLGIIFSPNSIRMEKCKCHLKATWGSGYCLLSLPHWDRAYLCPSSFIGRILLSSHLSKARHGLGSENTSPEGLGENVSSPHYISRSSQNVGSPSLSTILLCTQARWKVQRSSMRALMCYLFFCSTPSSMLLKFY